LRAFPAIDGLDFLIRQRGKRGAGHFLERFLIEDLLQERLHLLVLADELLEELAAAFNLDGLQVLVERHGKLGADEHLEEIAQWVVAGAFLGGIVRDLGAADREIHLHAFDLLKKLPIAVLVLFLGRPAKVERLLLDIFHLVALDHHRLGGIGGHFLIEGFVLLKFPLQLDGASGGGRGGRLTR
jgi:hypothetical protein